jgi:hypothetical protein
MADPHALHDIDDQIARVDAEIAQLDDHLLELERLRTDPRRHLWPPLPIARPPFGLLANADPTLALDLKDACGGLCPALPRKRRSPPRGDLWAPLTVFVP